jgi:hypothetical protein
MTDKSDSKVDSVLWLLVAGAAIIGLSAAACGSSVRQDPPAADMSFEEALASLPDVEVTPYWLGEVLEVGGDSLRGPLVCRVGCELTTQSIEARYESEEGTGTRLSFSLVTPGVWRDTLPRLQQPGGGSVEVRDVDVAGKAGTLLRYTTDAGQTRLLLISVQLDDVTVAFAYSESAPLLDQGTLLAVMNMIRPFEM